MANGLVGRVWEHPWQIMRRMWLIKCGYKGLPVAI